MEKHIRLLDCTLRDGGHIVQGKFGEHVIRSIIEKLVEAGLDIIEVGFLWDSVYGTDTARYYNIEDVKRILPKDHGKSKFSLMADFIDLEHLEPCDGTIEIIRLSFKRWRLDWALNTARILMNKGYKVFINPVNNNVYSDKQYIEVLEKVNELHPYGFSIVDTFGVMRLRDLSHRYYLVEDNLLPDITIGIHLHENLGLAYSLAQHIIQIANPKRNIVIDGSLLGMGRVPGNLCIEHIMDYMNEQFGTGYALEPVYDAIDDYIAPIKAHKPWGYDIPYALSAKFYLHRTYAEYLIGKQRLKTKDIQRILAQVKPSEAETFNEEYIEALYLDYLNVIYDDKKDIEKLKSCIEGY
jgi:4-hydroxy 2-oxovalerate aldolase